jgi:hypothetical protein
VALLTQLICNSSPSSQIPGLHLALCIPKRADLPDCIMVKMTSKPWIRLCADTQYRTVGSAMQPPVNPMTNSRANPLTSPLTRPQLSRPLSLREQGKEPSGDLRGMDTYDLEYSIKEISLRYVVGCDAKCRSFSGAAVREHTSLDIPLWFQGPSSSGRATVPSSQGLTRESS